MKTIGDILGGKQGKLAALAQFSRAGSNLARLFATIIQGKFPDGYTFASYQEGKLTVLTKSGSWATRLRYATPELIKMLAVHPEFSALKEIRCVVRGGDSLPYPTITTPDHTGTSPSRIPPEHLPAWRQTLVQLQAHSKRNGTVKRSTSHRGKIYPPMSPNERRK